MGLQFVELPVGNAKLSFEKGEVDDAMSICWELWEEGYRTWAICQILVTDFEYTYHQARALAREFDRRKSA